MRKLTLFGVALLLLASFAVMAGEKEALPEGQQQATIEITGMSCGACCTKVENAVAKLDGVVKVTADYKQKMATVVFETAKVDLAKIVDTINTKTSFKAKAPDEEKT